MGKNLGEDKVMITQAQHPAAVLEGLIFKIWGKPLETCNSYFENLDRLVCMKVQGVWHRHEVTLPGSLDPQLRKAITFQTPNVGNCYQHFYACFTLNSCYLLILPLAENYLHT